MTFLKLHAAQTEAFNAVKDTCLPRYELQSIPWSRSVKDSCFFVYAGSMFVADSLVAGVVGVIDRVSSVAYALFSLIDRLFFGGFSHVRDFFFPVNPIDNQRHRMIIPRKWEEWLGSNLFFPGATTGMTKTLEDFPGTNESIGDKVVALKNILVKTSGDLRVGEDSFDCEVVTVISNEINAFAVPGGGVVFYGEFVKQLRKASEKIKEAKVTFPDGSIATVNLDGVTFDDALGALIAHEMSHVIFRHGLLEFGISLLVYVAVNIMYLLNLGDFENIGDIIDAWMVFRSRTDEYNADLLGAYLLQHSQGMNPLGELMIQQYIGETSLGFEFFHKYFEFMYTHPNTEHRKIALFAAIQEFAPEKLKDKVTWQIENPEFYKHTGHAHNVARDMKAKYDAYVPEQA